MTDPLPARRRLTRGRLAAPLAGLAGLAVGWPCVRLGWVDYDESVYARDNLYLLDLRDVGTLITSPGPFYQFQPTTYVSHAVDYALFGDSVFWFHAMSVLLYAVCCVLVARLAQVFVADSGWSRAQAAKAGFLAGLLFAVHPVHVECYAWLGDRKDLLACALGVWSYLVYRRLPGLRDRRRRLLGHLLGAALLWAALGAKLSAAPLGGCLALEGLLRARGGWRPRLLAALRWGGPALVMGLAFSVGWYALQSQYPLPLSRPSLGQGPAERALYVLRCYGHYVKLLGWPVDLAVHYYPRPRLGEWVVNLGWLLAGLGGVALAVRSRALRPLALWAAGWFGMCLVLVANIILLGYVNDRYLLLPSAGVACFAGAWLARGGRGRLAVGLGLALVWASLSAAQIPTWTSTRSLWTQTLRVDPHHPFALATLGRLEAAEGHLDVAADFAERARLEAPEADYPVLFAASLLDEQGEPEAAEALLQAQAAISYETTVVLYLGSRALEVGDVTGAARYADLALEREPRSLPALQLSAQCALRLGDPQRALNLCTAGLESAAPMALTLLATRAAVSAGVYARAERYLALVERAGRTWETDLLGARIAFELSDAPEVQRRLDACVEAVPRELGAALLEVVALLERSGRGEQALRVLREAQAPFPGLLLTRAHFEALYGDPQRARADLQAALEGEPQLRARAAADPALRELLPE